MPFIKSNYSLLGLLLLVTAVAYYPALDSRLLLDDTNNLHGLVDVGTKGYSYFSLSGAAGPSGRFVSLYTFALQHEHWPHNPYIFKLVNLLIHLLNGVLIYAITRVLSHHVGCEHRYAGLFPLIATALWLLQPIHVSAVLYVVQRMTLLSSLFSLTGILAYLTFWGSERLYTSTKQLLVFSLLFGSTLTLAVFSKENGILMPLLILVIEFTLLGSIARPRVWRKWAGVFLLLPLALLLIYLVYTFDRNLALYQGRPFSMTERLLTEARIIFVYLHNIILPRPSAFSLYHDDFPISTGLFSPFSTLFAVTGVCILIGTGLKYRRKLPVYAFAVFWFFGAHLLESSYLNLELYFEHRNYLAAYGVCLLLAWVYVSVLGRISKQALGYLLLIAVMAPVVTVSLLELNLWSKPLQQAIEWQQRSPGSPRALEDLANQYLLHGQVDNARETYHTISTTFPQDVYPYIKEIGITACIENKQIEPQLWEQALDKARTSEWNGFASSSELDALAVNIINGHCETINIYLLIRLIVSLSTNPEYGKDRAPLHELAAVLSAYLGEVDAALNNIDQALKLAPKASTHEQKIIILLEFGRLVEAEIAIEEFRQFLLKQPRALIAYSDALVGLEQRLATMKVQE